MSGAIPLNPLYAFMDWTGTDLSLFVTLLLIKSFPSLRGSEYWERKINHVVRGVGRGRGMQNFRVLRGRPFNNDRGLLIYLTHRQPCGAYRAIKTDL